MSKGKLEKTMLQLAKHGAIPYTNPVFDALDDIHYRMNLPYSVSTVRLFPIQDGFNKSLKEAKKLLKKELAQWEARKKQIATSIPAN